MVDRAILQAFADNAPVALLAVSPSGRIVYANRAMELLAARPLVPGDREPDLGGLVPPGQMERAQRLCLQDGVVLRLFDTGAPIVPGLSAKGHDTAFAAERRIPEVTASLEDRLRVAESRRHEAVEAARRDPATGLRNRIGLDADLEAAISQPPAPDQSLYLLFLDLDHFKHINDTFGHRTGDEVLRVVARRFRSVRSVCSAARIGGDEFALLLREATLTGPELAAAITRLAPRVFAPVRVDGRLIPVGGSVGVSVFGRDGFDAETMKLHADTALIEAKRRGKDRVKIFDRDLALRSERRRILERDLRRAIPAQALHVYFQPILPLRGQGGCGAEVLARWNHPVLGPVGPDEFVRIASDAGFISELDFSVMRAACAEARPWIRSGELTFLSFNVSPLEIVRPGHAETFLEILEAYGIPARRVCVEIVETAIVRDLKRATAALTKLKAAGVSIALDDYGTGYSNLRALLDLPIDKIKIDRSLVAEVAEDERAMRLVLSLVQLARVFKADLVPEGVENRAQAAMIASMGCHYAQGYSICAPLPGRAFHDWLSGMRCAAA